MKNLLLRLLSYLVNILLFIFIVYHGIGYFIESPVPAKDLFTSEELHILLKDYYIGKLQDDTLRSNIINILSSSVNPETKELLENITKNIRKPTLYNFFVDYWHNDIVTTTMITLMQKGIGISYPGTFYYWNNLSKIYKEYQNNYEDLYNEALADLLVLLLETQRLPIEIIDLLTN